MIGRSLVANVLVRSLEDPHMISLDRTYRSCPRDYERQMTQRNIKHVDKRLSSMFMNLWREVRLWWEIRP
jgi:hypothetical protein